MSAFAAEPFDDKFRQLDELLPTPSAIRTASGAPGHAYWQQRADYTIRATLDEPKRAISAAETVTYHNNSPDTLSYLWLQLDQNLFTPGSDNRSSATVLSRDAWSKSSAEKDGMRFDAMRSILESRTFQGGFNITSVKGADGRPLKFVINKTMMRIDMPQGLKPGAKFYCRQHKQFLGSGEFTLEFGDYDIALTVPADHIVAATGELQNPDAVLSATQRDRLRQARTAGKPVVIVTQAEAEAAEKSRSTSTKTWRFKAHNVRDLAWASSRKFIWDAQGYKKDGTDTMAMSYYPKEDNPLV